MFKEGIERLKMYHALVDHLRNLMSKMSLKPESLYSMNVVEEL